MKEIIKSACAVFLMLSLIPLAAFMFKPDSTAVFTVYDEATKSAKKLSEREYVLGALCCEMPPTFHSEALQAQAAAIYTNAYRSRCAGEEYNAYVNSEKWEGYTSEKALEERWGKSFEVYYDKMCKAVDSVLGVVVAYENSPIVAAYHSQSSGKTEAAENVWGSSVPYLVAVESEGDTFNSELESQKTVSCKQVRKILSEEFPEVFLPQDDALLLTEFTFSDSGTVLTAMAGNIKTTGQKLRSLFSLRSACFTAQYEDGNIIFFVKGYGHGVGMSQYGADFMARQGKNWQEILKHYYTGTVIMRCA